MFKHCCRGWLSGNTFKAKLEVHQHLAVPILIKPCVIENTIAFAPKYRRQVFYKEKIVSVEKILRQLCEWKGVKTLESEASPNHIHMLVSIPPSLSVSQFMEYLKGKSSLMIFDRDSKYKYNILHFSYREYLTDTVLYCKNHITKDLKNLK